MKLFGGHSPRDVIFLEPVRIAGEKLPRDKVRMLYCDAEGKVYAALIDKAVYKLAMDGVAGMESSNKEYATLGLEIGPGNFLPLVVEIGPGEVRALVNILDHARRSGRIPDILKNPLRQIIKLGQASRQEAVAETKSKNLEEAPLRTPPVLNRLPYYSERDMEFSMPIYKAEHSYPLIVLKGLPADSRNSSDVQRLLILDNDGDLAVIKVPFKLMVLAEKRLVEWAKKNDMQACVVLGKGSKGFDINFLMISQPQRKALDTMARQFEETGNGEQTIPAAARKVLTRARDMSAPLTG